MEIVQKSSLKKSDDFYPYVMSRSFLNELFYKNLKKESISLFKDQNYFQSNGGQQHRNNITLSQNNENYKYAKDRNSYLYQLYSYLDSKKFRSYLFEIFGDYLLKNGYLGSRIKGFFESKLDLEICQASANYENPFHVDTRKRVIHGLLYFGKEDLIGGELILAKHKEQELISYPQIPVLEDITKVRSIDPEDNTGLFILSTPNSYHKGQCGKGIRRFCYWGYNYEIKEKCWIFNKSWDKPMKFNQETLNYQKNLKELKKKEIEDLKKVKHIEIDKEKNQDMKESKNIGRYQYINIDDIKIRDTIIEELELKIKKLNRESKAIKKEFGKKLK